MKKWEYDNINDELEIIEEKIKLLRASLDTCQIEED